MNNRDVVSGFLHAALAGDDATTMALMHPSFFIKEAGSLPYAGTYHGVAGLKVFLERLSSCFGTHEVVEREIIGRDNDSVLGVLVDLSGSKGGKPFSVSVFERWVVRDGKVAEIWPYYWDTNVIAELMAR